MVGVEEEDDSGGGRFGSHWCECWRVGTCTVKCAEESTAGQSLFRHETGDKAGRVRAGRRSVTSVK